MNVRGVFSKYLVWNWSWRIPGLSVIDRLSMCAYIILGIIFSSSCLFFSWSGRMKNATFLRNNYYVVSVDKLGLNEPYNVGLFCLAIACFACLGWTFELVLRFCQSKLSYVDDEKPSFMNSSIVTEDRPESFQSTKTDPHNSTTTGNTSACDSNKDDDSHTIQTTLSADLQESTTAESNLWEKGLFPLRFGHSRSVIDNYCIDRPTKASLEILARGIGEIISRCSQGGFEKDETEVEHEDDAKLKHGDDDELEHGDDDKLEHGDDEKIENGDGGEIEHGDDDKIEHGDNDNEEMTKNIVDSVVDDTDDLAHSSKQKSIGEKLSPRDVKSSSQVIFSYNISRFQISNLKCVSYRFVI